MEAPGGAAHHQEVVGLAPVVPIVFHTGRSEWKTGRNLGELFEAPELLRRFVPRWPILFWEIEQSTEALVNAAGAFLQTLAVVRACESNRSMNCRCNEPQVHSASACTERAEWDLHEGGP